MAQDKSYKPNYEKIAAYLSGNAAQNDIELIESWIDSAAENKKEFEKLEKTWLLTQCTEHVCIDTERAWHKVNHRANIRPVERVLYFSKKIYMRAAAVLAIGIGAWYMYQQMPRQNTIVANNEVLEIKLPDGSQVDLNRNAKLTYPTKFKGAIRQVALSGEAFFNITRKPEQPFVITTELAEIKVLGTSFNVSNNEKGELEVIVKSGYVTVTSAKLGENVLLCRNDRATVAQNGKIVKSINNNDNCFSWKTRSFVFRETALEKVYPVIAKAYGLKIAVTDSSILSQKLTATYDNLNADTLMEIINRTFGLQSVKTGNEYSVSAMAK